MKGPRFRDPAAAGRAIAERSPGLKKPTLRRYSWSRLHSDLLDDIRWPLVARRAQAPLPVVEALVVRLELHASKSQPRGYVGDFNAEAMAVRWGADVDMVLRVFAELERADVGWIDQEHVVSFWARNPDGDQDPTAAERQARKRDRDRALRLAILSGAGVPADFAAKGARPLTAAERKQRQRLRDRLEREAASVTKGHETRVTGHASRDANVTGKALSSQELDASRRDSVTSRPEQTREVRAAESVTVLGSNLTPIDPSVFVDRAAALRWLKGDGEALVTGRLGLRSSAAKAIERWDKTLCHDTAGLARIVHASMATAARGEAYRTLVERQVARQAAELIAPALPLPPMGLKRRGDG
jgi:hypothetical protein